VTKSDRIPGRVYLWLAIVIFGSSSAIVRKLTDIGSHHLVNGHNPISLCNVLFVGNLCALGVFLLLYHKQLQPAAIGRVSRTEWIKAIVVGILAGGIAPALIFQALGTANVNNIILVGRLEQPLTLLLSSWLLGERINRWEKMGTIGSFIGIFLTIALPLQESHPDNLMMSSAPVQLGWGEVFAAIAAIALSISTVVTKRDLSQMPLGLYSVVRTAIGTVVFFVTAMILYGSAHFMEAFSPFLWQWMLVYGILIVVIGQSLWFRGSIATDVSTSASIGSFAPVAGVLAAYFILGEVPTKFQYIGGSILLISIFGSQIAHRWNLKSEPLTTDKTGFTGM
jgi:drug/metabolite transporter (DMT)-like permease